MLCGANPSSKAVVTLEPEFEGSRYPRVRELDDMQGPAGLGADHCRFAIGENRDGVRAARNRDLRQQLRLSRVDDADQPGGFMGDNDTRAVRARRHVVRIASDIQRPGLARGIGVDDRKRARMFVGDDDKLRAERLGGGQARQGGHERRCDRQPAPRYRSIPADCFHRTRI